MSEPRYGTPRYELAKLRQELARMDRLLETEEDRMLAEEEGGQIKALVPYQLLTRSWDSRTVTLKDVEAAYAEDKKAKVVNEGAIKNNRTLLDAAIAMLEKLGFQAKKAVRKNRRKGWESVPTEWHTILSHQAKCSSTWHLAEQKHKDLLWVVAERERMAAEENAARQRETEAAEKKRVADIAFAKLLVKYDCDGTTWDDLLDHVLSKDKYLRLAHFLMSNRNDWSDGPGSAKHGLSGFTTETEEDRDIAKCIRGHIDNWDGDGRIFRDCEYNYTVLFAKVPAELKADYDEASSHIELC